MVASLTIGLSVQVGLTRPAATGENHSGLNSWYNASLE
jgi:hypothetical protein